MTPHANHAPAPDQDLVLTVKEVAQNLKISLWMVNKLIRENKLRSVQIGSRRLVPSTDLEEYLRELRKRQAGVRHGF